MPIPSRSSVASRPAAVAAVGGDGGGGGTRDDDYSTEQYVDKLGFNDRCIPRRI